MKSTFECWLLNQYGSAISSVASEEYAAELAEHYPNNIYFFAELSVK